MKPCYERRLYHWRSVNGQRPGMILRKLAMELAVMAGIALVVAFLGPFGSFSAPLGTRILGWELFAFVGYACFRPVIAAGDIVAAHTPLPRLVAIGLACLIAAMPAAVLIAWMMRGDALATLDAGALARIYGQVVLLGLVATLVQMLVAARRADVPAPIEPSTVMRSGDVPSEITVVQGREKAADEGTEAPAAPPRLRDRLPPGIAGAVVALASEDHYVRVYTENGNALVLMRIGDAIGELNGIDGARTHRSWWVARSAFAGVERRGRAVSIRLVNGLEVPVARSTVSELRARGWF